VALLRPSIERVPTPVDLTFKLSNLNPMNTHSFRLLPSIAACGIALLAGASAQAHIALTNASLPVSAAGQSSYAVANTTNELVFNVPHGCTSSESTPAFTGANLDTKSFEVTIPAAVVTATTLASLRPAMDGLFGTVGVSSQSDGSAKLVWTRKLTGTGEQNATTDDNQLYKFSVRLKVPAVASSTDVSIRKFQFLAVQRCVNNGTTYTMDWGTANSPTLLVFPDKRKGFNKYTLDATTTAADFTAASGTATLAAKLKSYFGDAAIVWVGKQGYSANPNTTTKINNLVAKDSSYSELGAKAGASIAPTETLWVKY
jgi:hypothetical protein